MSVLPTHSVTPSPTSTDPLTSNELTSTAACSHTEDSHLISDRPLHRMGKNSWGRRMELICNIMISSRYGRVILTFLGLLFTGMIFFPTATEPIAYSPDANFTVLPLGDSITWGYGATDGNGYRRRLQQLVPELKFVGTQQSGNMTNSVTESYPGARVHDIAMKARQGLAMNPDIIMLMIGTNDFQLRLDEFTTPKKMEVLLDDIDFIAPDSLLIVAQVTPQKQPSINAYIKAFNRKLPAMIKTRQKAGRRILLVDMYPVVDPADFFDDMHPSEKGFDAMADVWFGGLEQAVRRGWI